MDVRRPRKASPVVGLTEPNNVQDPEAQRQIRQLQEALRQQEAQLKALRGVTGRVERPDIEGDVQTLDFIVAIEQRGVSFGQPDCAVQSYASGRV